MDNSRRYRQRRMRSPTEIVKKGAGNKTAENGSNSRMEFRQEILFLALKILTIMVLFLLVFTFLFGICRNKDASMDPAVKDGDLVIFDRLNKRYIKSDVLVLKYRGEKQTRRVIAVAGDEVDVTEEGLVINGSLQQESEIFEKTFRYDTGIEFPMKVGEGEVFVLGDGREHSTDSRMYGCVKTKDTLGKVITIIRRRGI